MAVLTSAESGRPQKNKTTFGLAQQLSVLLIGLFAVFLSYLAAARETCPECQSLRNVLYLTGQHQDVPLDLPEMKQVTHIVLAFMPSSIFNDPREEKRIDWPLFMSVNQVRSLLDQPTSKSVAPVSAAREAAAMKKQVLVAIGGWGDTAGFSEAAKTKASRERFARNVAAMVTATGADGVDIDWEYPGGNGEDYRKVPNAEKAWEIQAYPLLLAAIRVAVGPDKIISAAVPGKPEDMLAFTLETVPRIMRSVDFFNVMTYDLMNRRNNVTTHHAGIKNSLVAIDAYLASGAAPNRLHLGFAYYVKYFKTEHDECQKKVRNGQTAIGCQTLVMEDPDTGEDLGLSGAFAWDDNAPEAVHESFLRALHEGVYDEVEGGQYFWDRSQDLWWTFETPQSIEHKFSEVAVKKRLGGVFAWGLGEDAPFYQHFQTVSHAIESVERSRRDNR